MKAKIVWGFLPNNPHAPDDPNAKLHTEIIDTDVNREYDGATTVEEVKDMFYAKSFSKLMPRIFVEECVKID